MSKRLWVFPQLKGRVLLATFMVLLATGFMPVFAQIIRQPGLATEPADTEGFQTQSVYATAAESLGAPLRKVSSAAPVQKKSGYTTNSDTETLQKAVDRWNEEQCPPQNPIREITTGTLSSLAKYQLINRSDIEKYSNVVLVNGKVYEKEEPAPEPEPVPRPPLPGERVIHGGGSLMGTLEALVTVPSDKQAKDGRGNPKFDSKVQLKSMNVSVRDERGRVVKRQVFVPILPQHKAVRTKGETFPDVPDVIRDSIAPAKRKRKTWQENVKDTVDKATSDTKKAAQKAADDAKKFLDKF